MVHILRVAGRNAVVTGIVKDLRKSVSSLSESSGVVNWGETRVRALRNAWATSTTESGTLESLAVLGPLIRGSLVARTVLNLTEPITEALDQATVTNLARWTEATARASWLYRWLTAEPEPEVIVIDLRETISVGPVIAALDQLIRWVVPASHRSTAIETAERVHQVVIAAPIRAASVFLGAAILSNLGITFLAGEPTEAGVIARVILLGLAALGSRVSISWDTLTETRAVQLLIALLEPPEPPEDRNR